jgi:hypothetical protein
MSKHIRVILATLLIVAAAVVFFPSGYVSAGGLVVNSGFEYGEGELPYGWVLTGNATRLSTGPIREGEWVAQITGPGDTLTQWVANITTLTEYRAWAWMYVSGNVTGVIALDFWTNEEGTQLSPTIMLSTTDTNNYYVQQTTTMQPPSGATHVRIRLLGTDWTDEAEVRFDGIGLWPSGRTFYRDQCFVATAAYGTPMAEEIHILRQFRDGYLLTNPPGKALVDLYYRVSPPLAEFMTEHPSLKPLARAVLAPAVAISTVAVNTTPVEKTAIAGLFALVSVTLAVWAAKRRAEAKLRGIIARKDIGMTNVSSRW